MDYIIKIYNTYTKILHKKVMKYDGVTHKYLVGTILNKIIKKNWVWNEISLFS